MQGKNVLAHPLGSGPYWYQNIFNLANSFAKGNYQAWTLGMQSEKCLIPSNGLLRAGSAKCYFAHLLYLLTNPDFIKKILNKYNRIRYIFLGINHQKYYIHHLKYVMDYFCQHNFSQHICCEWCFAGHPTPPLQFPRHVHPWI